MYKMLLSIMKGRNSWGKGANGTCNPSLLSLGESVSRVKKILSSFRPLFNAWVYLTLGFEAYA